MDHQAFAQLLGNYGEFVGAIAVVATLVYAVQVRHSKDSLEANTAALTAQTRQTAMETAIASLHQLTAMPEIAIALSGAKPLTDLENAQLDSFLAALMRGSEFSWLQHESGAIDESQWETDVTVIRVYMDSFLIRQWWEKLGCDYSGSGFVDFVDKLLAETEPTNRLWEMSTRWSEIEGRK
ncbi:MAG: hypothetical protein GKR90_22670 [Pseudomonadales bacterium]|nr:hypothetical protein [Pseudomonadales bacterium]